MAKGDDFSDLDPATRAHAVFLLDAVETAERIFGGVGALPYPNAVFEAKKPKPKPRPSKGY